MFPGSDFYGIKNILLKYAGLPKFLPLPVAVQHGWQSIAHSFEASAKPPEIWVWSERIKRELVKYYPEDRIRVIGSFFEYLIIDKTNSDAHINKIGSICIPPHSSHFIKTYYPIEEFINQLKGLGDEYKPITIMLYYLDMTDETVAKYQGNGFKVVSNGSLFNDEFLHTFSKNVEDKHYCIFTSLNSGVFFAARLGAKLRHLNIPSRVVNEGNAHFPDGVMNSVNCLDNILIPKLGLDIIEAEMGVKHILSREEMRRFLFKNYLTWSFSYKFIRLLIGRVLRFIHIRKQVTHD